MRVIGLIVLVISMNAFSESTFTSKVHDIDHGMKPEEETLIFFTNGQVVKFATFEKALLDQFHEAKINKEWLEVSLDEKRVILDARVTDYNEPAIESTLGNSTEKSTDLAFVPTTIPSMAKAQQYFREARYNPKESQCFNRALIWSYEWWKQHSLKSNKIFIYFTRNYIRRYNFEWWFHIAPAVHVMHNGQVVERAMDRKYSSGPKTYREWTNIFMKNDAECKVITKYSQYADHPYAGECFIMRTNMYTWQPADLQMNEAWNYTKNIFKPEEVRAAYLEAYDEIR